MRRRVGTTNGLFPAIYFVIQNYFIFECRFFCMGHPLQRLLVQFERKTKKKFFTFIRHFCINQSFAECLLCQIRNSKCLTFKLVYFHNTKISFFSFISHLCPTCRLISILNGLKLEETLCWTGASLRGYGVLGLRQINTCRKVHLQAKLLHENILRCLLWILSFYAYKVQF